MIRVHCHGVRAAGVCRFAAFCERFIKVPKGTGALTALRLRDWQRGLVGSVLDAEVQHALRGGVCRVVTGNRLWLPLWRFMS